MKPALQCPFAGIEQACDVLQLWRVATRQGGQVFPNEGGGVEPCPPAGEQFRAHALAHRSGNRVRLGQRFSESLAFDRQRVRRGAVLDCDAENLRRRSRGRRRRVGVAQSDGKRVRSCRRGCRAAVLRPPPLHAQRRSAESRVIDRATARKPGRQGLCRGGARCWQMHTSGEGNGAPVLRHRRPLRCSGGRSQGFRTPTSCRTSRPADRCQLHGA